jgi:hypothetical protein
MGEGSGLPVCVLGSGRSGTSLLARAVSLLGVDFGAQEAMLQANELNPRGFWELLDVCALNDDVQASWGGSHFEPPRLEQGWEQAPELEPFRARIEAIVESHFPDGRRWGFKHSGNTLTSPLWRSVVGELDYVICVRNPIEVDASGRAGWELLKMNREIEPPDDWQLWVFFYCEALRNTAGARRAFVFYDDWFSDPRAVVDYLARFLYDDTGRVSDETRAGVATIVEDGLYRQRATELDLASDEQVPIEVRALYFLMRDLANAESRGEERAQALQAVAKAMDHRWLPRRSDETAPR